MVKDIQIKRTGFGYASTASILKTFDWHTNEELPDPVTPKGLHEKGIPERDMYILPRTLQDFRLIDSAGHPTKRFDQLAAAIKEKKLDEYQKILKKILLEDTYQEISHLIVDPAKATPSQFEAAFEKYEPRSERPKMISLYKGLCREAGLMPPLEGITRTEKGRFAKATSNAKPSDFDSSQESDELHYQGENIAEETIGEKTMNGFNKKTSPHLALNIAKIGDQRDHLTDLLQLLPLDAEELEQKQERWIDVFKRQFDHFLILLEGKE